MAVFQPETGSPAKVTVRLCVKDGRVSSVAGETLSMCFRTAPRESTS